MNDSDSVVLSANHLTKWYREGEGQLLILDHINFSLRRGERVAILGASGSGKSTFLQLMGGLDTPSAGEVIIAGKSVALLNERERSLLRNQEIGFVYQFHHLLPEFNALENVCMPLLIRGGKPKIAQARAMDFIDHVGLTARAKHRVGELSGGERQRIAIARALVTEPSCVLADEPTGNLDQLTAESITELILNLNFSLKISFVLVTHNRAFAAKMNHIYRLNKGKLILEEAI